MNVFFPTQTSQTPEPVSRSLAPLGAPVSTYRLQLSRDFPFQAFSELIDYLHTLGVTDCYSSPVLTARAGSTHCYDICNHGELNPDLGTRDELRRLSAMLRERRMGLILDFVPNHMGIDPRTNRWWWDVLENGPCSPHARYFDIDWSPIKPELVDKVLLPILGDQYGRVLERGELRVAHENGALVLHYFDRVLPVNPRQAPMLLGHRIDDLAAALGEQDADLRELRSILTALSNLPATNERDESRIVERQREKEVARDRLAALVARSPAIAQHIAKAVEIFNGTPGDAASFDNLHALLETQAYRLAYWRTAFDEINYRRFFDVNELAGLRMEDPRVFADTHALLLDLIEEGLVTGLRIDHPDGLFDPPAYCASLQAAIGERLKQPGRPFYVLVEKILARSERLREDWEVHGTTGYNQLNTINGLFVHPEGLADLRRVYRKFARHRDLPSDTMYVSKRFMMRNAMASELNVLARALSRLSEMERESRDFTLNGLRRALVEVIACFPVYRTYITERGTSPEDVSAVDTALAEARRRNPVEEPSIFEFLRTALLPAPAHAAADDPRRDRRVAFAQKFQQYTSPIVAKGLEDTAFYRDVLLLSANEVGGDPRYRTRSITEFHAENWHRLSTWPYEMTTVATHDTKRGEDARARINVLSELADEWRTQLARWASINDPARTRIHAVPAPDRNDEWLFYQALVGAWPAEAADTPIPSAAPEAFVKRMQQFMNKAIKEAKRHTGWLHANADYEEAVNRFVHSVLAGDRAESFLSAFLPFQRRVAWFGMLGSLSQVVLQVGSPGVPDLYQGGELWNFSLVDPDNRRPVDFAHRRALLDQLLPVITAVETLRESPGDVPSAVFSELRGMFEQWWDGRAKLYTLAVALRLRRAEPELFLHGEYQPLGSDIDDPHLIAFTRRLGDREVIVLVSRFAATLLRGTPRPPFGVERWRTMSVRLPARLAGARMTNIFTGERIEPVVYRQVPWLLAGSAFQSWPAAILWVE